MEPKIGTYRWRIVAFLFFATTINYIDRQIMGILAPELQKTFHWSESDYGFIITAFQLAYAIGLITTGRLLDKMGTKLGYSISIALWSVAGIFHAAACSIASFSIARFSLGLGESANFPAAIKTVAEWFPKKERALATGIFNSGTNIAAVITPLVIPIIALKWGWQWAFIGTGLLGIIWLLFWIPFYTKPEINKQLKLTEKNYILSDDGNEQLNPVKWIKIMSYKQTLGICLARFVTDPVWWFFLYWLPKFLNSRFNTDLLHIGLPIIIIYIFSSGGSIAGGWFSSYLIKRGRGTVEARKISILLLALLVVPIFAASVTTNLWTAVFLISLATFAHQGYAANIFTIVSDIYPKNAVGSMIGLSGFAGAIGGILFSTAVGLILEHTGNYYIVFGISSISYLACWIALKIFVPNHKKIVID